MVVYVLQTLVMILIWLVLSILVVSFMEYSIHSQLMHKMRFITWLKRVLHNHPLLRERLVAYFLEVLTHHRDFHHVECYRTTFDHAEDKNCLASINQGSVQNELLLMLPLWGPLLYFAPLGGCILVAVLTLHALLFTAFHEEMHEPQGTRWFSRYQPFRAIYLYIARFHWLHHRYPGKNFSGLFPPVFDWLFGTMAKAAPEDLGEMERIKLL
jgi:hypothetical protein